MTDRWTRRSAVVATLGGLTLPARAQSEPYPSRPLKIIVPTPPGGGADAFARVIGARLGEQMKATVIIENRPGAAGNAAAEQVIDEWRADGVDVTVVHLPKSLGLPHDLIDPAQAVQDPALVYPLIEALAEGRTPPPVPNG